MKLTKKSRKKKNKFAFYPQLINFITSAFKGGVFKKRLFWFNGINNKTSKTLAILAIAFLILQIANGLFLPQPSVASDGKLCSVDVDAVLIMDVSGSMGDTSRCDWWQFTSNEWIQNTTYNQSQTWCILKNQSAPHESVWLEINPKKIDSAKTAANSFIDKLQTKDQSALVSFNSLATLVKGLSNNHSATKTAIDALVTGGSTNIGGAIEKGINELGSVRANSQANKIMILLTDGLANKPNGNGYDENPLDVAYALDKAQAAAALGYKIFTIGLGSDGEINETMLQQIASSTAAKYYHASNGTDLGAIYDQIAWEVCQYGSIAGCKFQDIGQDHDISGDPKLADWEIVLTNNATQATFSQQTAADGCFTFAGLLEGDYSVQEGVNLNKQPYTQTYPANPVYNLTLAEGQNIADIDFGNYLAVCGNSFLDSGEECDDGNIVDGDSCSATCRTEIPTNQADLAVTKTVDQPTPNVNDSINYTINLLNNGPDEAVNVTLSDLLSSWLNFVSAIPSVGSYFSNTGLWNVGNLLNGVGATLQINALVSGDAAGQTIINTATGNSDTADPNSANNVGTVSLNVQTPEPPKQADLAVTKTADDNTPDENQNITFTISVRNNGPDNATAITLSDLLPVGLTFISDNPSQGAYVSNTGVWSVGDLSSGASVSLEIVAKVNVGTGGSTIINAATVSGQEADSNTGNNVASASVTINQPAPTSATLLVIKNVINDNGGTATSSDFTINVNGSNPAPASFAGSELGTNVTLAAGAYSVGETPVAGYASSLSVDCSGTIALGENKTCTVTNDDIQAKLTVNKTVSGGTALVGDFTLKVGATSVTSGQIVGFNVGAYIISEQGPTNYTGSFTGDCDTQGNVTLAIGDDKICNLLNTFSEGGGPSGPQADLAVSKSVDDNTVDIGQTIIFTIGVTNAGPDTAPGVTLNDLLPAGLTFVSATSTLGDYASSTGVWTIGNLAISQTETLEITVAVSGIAGQQIVNGANIVIDPQIDINISNNSASASVIINIPPLVPTPPSGDGGVGGGGGGGFLPPSNAYQNWLNQQAAPAPSASPAATPTPAPQGEVKGATTLPATGFDLTEVLALVALMLAMGAFALVARKRLNFDGLMIQK